MEWSPIHPSAQRSSSDWVLQWVCRSCGSSTSMQDIPALPAVSCPQYSSSVAIVFDRPTGRVVRFYVSCQLVVPHDSVSPPPQLPVPPAPAPPPDNEPPADWFSHCPLSRFPSLCGWGRGDPTPPGSGTQSWLFCPLISRMDPSQHHESGRFDAPFSYNEIVAALSKCPESAPGADCLPYLLFKVSFPWWRHFLLLQPRSAPHCGSVRLEVQPCRPCHQVRW